MSSNEDAKIAIMDRRAYCRVKKKRNRIKCKM